MSSEAGMLLLAIAKLIEARIPDRVTKLAEARGSTT
jgi:hypothetical protein